MDRVAKLSRIVTTNGARRITFEAATMAKFADGACTCSLGDTSVLVTAVSDKLKKPSPSGFVPLTVEYKQKAAAAGRIPMTHLRRDIGVTEREILIGRMIDRSIRPAFTKGYYQDTQIICNQLALDGLNDADVLAINGASASLSLSDIPWNGPIGAVRVGLIGDKMVCNPTRHEISSSRLDLVLTANRLGNIVMMEGSCKEPVLIPDVIKAMRFAIKECRTIIDAIAKLQATIGKPKRPLDLTLVPTEEHMQFVYSQIQEKIRAVLCNYSLDKMARGEAFKLIQDDLLLSGKEKFPTLDQSILNEAFVKAVRVIYRNLLIETNIRCDGRMISEMRPLDSKVDLYKPLHGSALFQRGQTQVFCSTTFDSPDAAYRNDNLTSIMSGVKEKNFMLHYEFPPYATNEIGRVGTLPSRREIGHGALAEKAIRPLVPENLDMTIRLNCEVLESNGSSSMASVCAGSLSLMDAGVKIREHVAGVAMGLIGDPKFTSGVETEGKKAPSTEEIVSNSIILTDILGFEDFFGDMDFKIAGTKKALTAFQLDVKPIDGVHSSVIYQAIQRAHTARSEIISHMEKTIKSPRSEKKDNHPVMKTIHIPPHQIASFVGFGGSNLKRMMATVGVRISAYGNPDEQPNQGASNDNFIIFAPNKDAMAEAEETIKSSIERQKEPELEFNGIYTATIVEIKSNGVLVTLYPNMKPTLLPLSQLDIRAVNHPSALNFEVGQQIQVKYFGRDPASGQMRISRKSLMMSGVSRVHRTPPG